VKEKDFNPLQHIMVPKHEILSDEEIEKLLKEYQITKEQLPKIKVNDPAVVAIKAKIGDVLIITRKSKTSGTSVFYRLVIA